MFILRLFKLIYGDHTDPIPCERGLSVKQIVYNLNIGEKIEECIISTDEDPSIRIERSKNLHGVSTKLK